MLNFRFPWPLFGFENNHLSNLSTAVEVIFLMRARVIGPAVFDPGVFIQHSNSAESIRPFYQLHPYGFE